MTNADAVPRLWSDFDGTAVNLYDKYHPLNITKYPLPRIAGYTDFLRGVQNTGVELGGVISARPDIRVRRLATGWSVANLGLKEFFGRRDQIRLMGSDLAKGRFLASESRERTVGMIDDKPNRLGVILLGLLAEPAERPGVSCFPVILGVVAHKRSIEYTERLIERVDAVTSDSIQVSEISRNAGAPSDFSIRSASLSLQVVPLQPYSEQTGQEFGNRLLDAV